jgi:hypothetical protein
MSVRARAVLVLAFGVLASWVPGAVPESAAFQVDAAPVPDTLDGAPYVALPGRRVTVYHVPTQAALAERMRDLLDAQAPLPALPDSIPSGVHAVLAHSPAALDAAIGGAVPEWRAGVAVPSRDLLVIPSGEGTGVLSGEGLRTLRHEWAHLGLHQFLGGLRIPRWFNEGYAEWAAGGFDATEVWRLRVGLAFGGTPVLDSITLGWPGGREQARTAYLLSASAVTYLLEGSGERGLAIFLERWRDGRSFEAALRQTYGVTSGQLEEDWRAHVKSRYGWLFVLARSSVFWLLLGGVLVYMVRVRKVRNDEKLARLRAEELPDLPAYWNLEPIDLRQQAPPRDPARPGDVDPDSGMGG